MCVCVCGGGSPWKGISHTAGQCLSQSKLNERLYLLLSSSTFSQVFFSFFYFPVPFFIFRLPTTTSLFPFLLGFLPVALSRALSDLDRWQESCIFQRFVFSKPLPLPQQVQLQQAPLQFSVPNCNGSAVFPVSRTMDMHSDMGTIVACLHASAAQPATQQLPPSGVLQSCVCLDSPDSGLWTLDSHSLSFIEAFGLLFCHWAHNWQHLLSPVSCLLSPDSYTRLSFPSVFLFWLWVGWNAFGWPSEKGVAFLACTFLYKIGICRRILIKYLNIFRRIFF